MSLMMLVIYYIYLHNLHIHVFVNYIGMIYFTFLNNLFISLFQGDHNHLFIRQGTGLQGQAVFRTKLTFRPHSTESFTHRKLTLSLADRTQKTVGVKVLSTVFRDPESSHIESIRVCYNFYA